MTDTDNRDATILALREALGLARESIAAFIVSHKYPQDSGAEDVLQQVAATLTSTAQAAAQAEARIRADEREMCARIAESAPYKRGSMICGCSEGLADFTAAAIRARSQEGE